MGFEGMGEDSEGGIGKRKEERKKWNRTAKIRMKWRSPFGGKAGGGLKTGGGGKEGQIGKKVINPSWSG